MTRVRKNKLIGSWVTEPFLLRVKEHVSKLELSIGEWIRKLMTDELNK